MVRKILFIIWPITVALWAFWLIMFLKNDSALDPFEKSIIQTPLCIVANTILGSMAIGIFFRKYRRLGALWQLTYLTFYVALIFIVDQLIYSLTR
jgi:hypothetical protein